MVFLKDARNRRAFGAFSALALALLLGLTVFASISNPGLPAGTSSGVGTSASGNFDQLVVVLMENHDIGDIYGPAPYMTQLADQYAFSQHWASITNPSQPNYIALLGGSTFGVVGDGNHPNLNQPTMVDIITRTGKTWKAFAEDATGTGANIHPPRGEDHFPFLSYTTITSNSSRTVNLLPGTGAEVIAELGKGTNFIWLTPNDCNNMHSCSVATGDAWIQSWVPGLLTAMAGKKAALILMFDEGYANPPLIYMGFSGPATKAAYKSTASYNHYSLLKLLEDVWGGGSLGQGDVNAPSPVEFFNAGGPDFSLSANPTSVSFASGGSATSTISLTATGGFTGTVDLAAVSVPLGVTTSCVPASISGSQTSTCTMTSGSSGTYAVTVTGASGSLVHTAAIAVTVTSPGPTARFTFSPTSPQVNDPVNFDASSSSDTDPGATLQARWDWEGDGTWDTPLSPTLTAQHAYSAPGPYTASLQIQDSHGFTDITTHRIFVLAAGDGSVGAPPGYGITDPSKLQAHGPIYIGSNVDFTAANGVRSGSGTVADPYIISDWFIDGNLYPTIQAMIWIESTNAYVIVQNVQIANLLGANQWEGVQLGHWPAIISTSHVTIRNIAVENSGHAYGIAIREGSSDIHVEANYVSFNANFEWMFGLAADRGVSNVTFYGNYVNAYTSGTFHTVGIHLGDVTVVGAGHEATGLVAERNTVVNATGGAIVSQNSRATVIRWNLVYMDYPGSKSVGTDFPRGIDTEWFSNDTAIIGNAIHTFHWGIQVGSDRGLIHSNTIYDVDYAIYVVDSGSAPGMTSAQEHIYNTTYSNVVTSAIRLPTAFSGTAVDVGPGARTTDLTGVRLVTDETLLRVDYTWSGSALKLTAIVGGATLFDSSATTDSQTVQASWSGTVGSFGVTEFSPSTVVFQLASTAAVLFDGSGYTPGATYNLTRSNPGGITQILSVVSTPTGGLSFAIPIAAPSSYVLTPDSFRDTNPPVTTYSAAGSAGGNGWFMSAVTVTLSATDDFSGVRAVHFQQDGGAWQVYSAPFSVSGDGTHTILYYATDNSGNNETSRTMSVKIDTVAPSSLVQFGGTLAPDGSYIATVNVTVSSTDATSGVQSIQYRIDGGGWRTYTAPFPLSGSGTHTIDYAATDTAGNAEAAKTSVVRVSGGSSATPVTVVQLSGTAGMNGWYVSLVTVTLSATSPGGSATSIVYSIDGGAWTTYTQPFTIPEGNHTLNYQSSDAAGYVEPMKTTTIGVDHTPPRLGVTPPPSPTASPDVTLTWTGSDASSGIARYEVSIDGGPFVSVGLSTSLSRQWSDGRHTVIVKAIDAAGNSDTTDASFSVSATPPGGFGAFQAIPLIFPAGGLVLLVTAVVIWRRSHRAAQEREAAGYKEEESIDPESEDSLDE